MKPDATRLLPILVMAVFSGCAVTLHGQQTSGGGVSTTHIGSSVQGSTNTGNARIGASFGTPPAANAPGGQVAFAKGASAVVVLGLAIAGTVDLVGHWLQPSAPRQQPSAGGIAHTCSCYGWQPELTAAPPQQ